MTPTHEMWQRLIAAARRAPSEGTDVTVPPGFATRVVALAFETAERPLLGLFERFSWRALGVAAVIAAASAALNLAPAIQALRSTTAIEQDPVSIVFDLSR